MLQEKSSCIFCNIAQKQNDSELIYEDDEVCVFRDIKPASKFHILTIPKVHIDDATVLDSSHIDLVKKMLEVSKDVLSKHNFSLTDVRFGYHWPPFRSVCHLHLHSIAPESEMTFVSRLVFMKNSFWFVTPEYIEKKLMAGP